MLVSVVIPTFNRAAFLGQAVRSVLEQSYDGLELIVVDDGSTDATPELLSGIDDVRLRILRQENQGVSAARNAGLRAAKGEMFALLDSDDYWLPRKLELQLAFMREAGFEMSQTQEIWIRHGKRVNPRKVHAKPSGEFFAKALEMCLVSPSCVMFTPRLWREIGEFDEDLPACEDYDYWLRSLPRFAVGLLDEALTVKRGGHPDQLSRALAGLDFYRVKALIKLRENTDISREQRELAELELRRKAQIFIAGCLKRGKLEMARETAGLAGMDFASDPAENGL